MTNTVGCGNCTFKGEEEDLLFMQDTEEPYKGDWIRACPECKTDAYLYDIESTEKKGGV